MTSGAFKLSSLSVPDGDEEEIMREVCAGNGLMYNRLRQEGLSCLTLEMFFSGYPRMVGLQHFPNLQVLRIVGQSVTKLDGLRFLPKLKELSVIECRLKSMAGLEDVKQLRRLYLYSNQISKIENLDHLIDLQALWLNDNNITTLEGLSSLRQLKELNVAENWIETIGNSLNNLQRLEMLELSGNRMYSFKDIVNLTRLGSLRSLGFKSPIYPPCGVGLLCNYTTHVIYHLSHLTQLDMSEIATKPIRDTIELTVTKKKTFYGMKVKTLQRKFSDIHNRLIAVRDHLTQPYEDRLRVLYFALKEIEREIGELESSNDWAENAGDSGSETTSTTDVDASSIHKWSDNRCSMDALKSKHKGIRDRIKLWERKVTELEYFYADAVERTKLVVDGIIHQVSLELETGGNIRFEFGKPSDPWYGACQDLVLSRFCAKDYREHNVISIQIQRITRVNNRILRTRFDDAIQAYLDDDDSYLPTTKQNSYKKHLEYLFWIWDPELTRGQNEPSRTLEEGFMSASTYEQLGRDAAVPLTNSIRLADRLRIDYCLRQDRGKDYADPCPFRNGRLVIAKAYIGKSAQVEKNIRVTESHFEKADSLYRLCADATDGMTNVEGGDADHCDCASRQCEWFIYNHETVIPEYIVDFEYVSLAKPKSPFHDLMMSELLGLEKVSKPLQWPLQDSPTPDDDVLNCAPEMKQRPRLAALSEELLLRVSKARGLNGIGVLNLHGNGLIRLKHLQALPLLRHLTVSFNDLAKLDDLSGLNIEYLDASFNKIVTLDGMKGMSKLKQLDVSWNRLQNTRDEISLLRKHAPVLTSLDVRHNPWQKIYYDDPESMRLRVIGRLRSLTRLNGVPVSESETSVALRMAAGSRITQVTLLSHSRLDPVASRVLTLMSTAQMLSHISRFKPDRMGGDQDVSWLTRITSVCLDGQHISKLSGLERLENLRWASFNDNDITKMEGLDNCSKLEELSLEHNCIRRLEGAGRWPLLRRLSLAHNFIVSIDGSGLEKLNRLQHLSLESNCIGSLAGLQRTLSITELYLSNNLVDNVREIFYLKNLPSLIILDVSGNPLSTVVENYRQFVVYHVKQLKALDGAAVEPSDILLAKEMFGGRLSQDFVAERLGHSNFNLVKELDFPQCGIQTVDLGNGQLFNNLRSVNVEHNNLTSFSGLVHLANLKVLCLNHNRVESVIARAKLPAQARAGGRQLLSSVLPVSSNESLTPILDKLEVLHLGYNGIKDLATLQLGRIPSLKAVFLQGNEISKVEGLENLTELLELVLDRNKIKSIGEFSFISQQQLQELHIEENRLRSLGNLQPLDHLQRLYVGMNRIQDMSELEKVEQLAKLTEISLINNAVAKRLLHRPLLVFRNPNLKVIDGITVTEEERTKAQLYFVDHQQQAPPPLLMTALDTTLPGINQYKSHVPVKVTNVQLLSPPQLWGTATVSGGDDGPVLHEYLKGAGKKKPGRAGLDSGNSMMQQMSAFQGNTMSYHHSSTPANLSGIGKSSGSGSSLAAPQTNTHYISATDIPNGGDRGKNAKR